MVNRRNLPKGATLFSFDKLSDAAKVRARAEVFQTEVNALSRNIQQAKEKAAVNINAVINDRYFISRLMNSYRLKIKLQDNLKLDAHIIGNLCEFTENGEYIIYSL